MKIVVLLGFVILSWVACSDDNKHTKPIPDEEALSGSKIFETNCKLCHAFTKQESNGMAPVLDSVFINWKNEAELKKFIHNAQENKDINEHISILSKRWKDKTQMPVFEALTDKELDNIIDYLKHHE